MNNITLRPWQRKARDLLLEKPVQLRLFYIPDNPRRSGKRVLLTSIRDHIIRVESVPQLDIAIELVRNDPAFAQRQRRVIHLSPRVGSVMKNERLIYRAMFLPENLPVTIVAIMEDLDVPESWERIDTALA